MTSRNVYFKGFGDSSATHPSMDEDEVPQQEYQEQDYIEQDYQQHEYQQDEARSPVGSNPDFEANGQGDLSSATIEGLPVPRTSRFAPNNGSTPVNAGTDQPPRFFSPVDTPSFFNNNPRRGAPRMASMGMQRMPFGSIPPFGMPGMRPPFPMPQASQPVNQAERLKKIAGVPADKELWVETKTADGKSYFYHAISRETVWEKPEGVVVLEQAQLQKLIEEAQKQEKEAQAKQEKAFAGFPHPFPGAGFGGPPGFPPFGMPPMDPSKAWREFKSPDGRPYYYNSISMETTWTKPDGFKSTSADTSVNLATNLAAQQQNPSQIPTSAYAGFASTAIGFTSDKQDTPVATEKKTDPKGRPASSHAVKNSPWCVVWTTDQKVFFYNPSTKTSVWDRPPELYNRADVDSLIKKIPNESSPNGTKRSASDNESDNDESHENTAITMEHDNAESGSDDSTSAAPAKKKTRKEKKKDRQLEEQRKEKERKLEAKKQPPKVEKVEDPAIRAELEAQQERAKIPLEERIKQFREMLEDKKVSTSSSWERELSKIVFDKRYLLLTAIERKAAFEAYVRERSEVEKAERKKRSRESKKEFKKLLEEANLHGKSSWSSFVNKFGKDTRFKDVERNRDREDAFKEFVDELYAKEKEEKKQREAKKEAERAAEKEAMKLEKTNDDGEIDETQPDETAEKVVEQPSAVEQAIENRKREVKSEKKHIKRELDKESEKQKVQEQEDNFKVLLIDLVKVPDLSWHDAKKLLKKDSRYEALDLLRKRQKERFFDDHIEHLGRRMKKLQQEDEQKS